MKQSEIENKTLITVPDTTNDRPLVNKTLSIQLSDFNHAILYVKDIKSKVLMLLILPFSLSENPRREKKNNHGKTFFAAGNCDFRKENFKCNYNGFQFALLCSDRVAIADYERLLKEFVQKINLGRKNLKNSTCSCMSSFGVGRKGQTQRRMRQYHSSNQETSAIDQSPFSEIWQHNKPLKILYVRDIPENN